MRPARLVSTLLTTTLICGMLAALLLIRDLGQATLSALPALPLAAAVHVSQLAAAAMAWRSLFHAPRPRFALMLRARWIRESLNGLLPLVGIGGGVLASTAVTRQTGLPVAGVVASATADLMVEASSQLPIVLSGLAVLGLVAPETLPDVEPDLVVLALVLVAAAALALRYGRARGAMAWLRGRGGMANRLSGLRRSLAAVDARPRTLLAAVGWHMLAWSLGAAEVWTILAVLGVRVDLAEAYAIESLGMAARTLGFLVPAGLGAQEAGLAAVAVSLGVPIEEAVAMSMLKRVRELAINLPGLLVWHRIEHRALRHFGTESP